MCWRIGGSPCPTWRINISFPLDEQKYPLPPTQNITDDLSTEESEGYTQFLQAFNIQLSINMDQEHKDLNNDEQEEETPPQEYPCTEVKDLPEEPEPENGPFE